MNFSLLYYLFSGFSILLESVNKRSNDTFLTTERNNTTKIAVTPENNSILSQNTTEFILTALEQEGQKWDKGINVSKWQPFINGTKVKEGGVNYAFVRSSEGGTYKDPKFTEHWNELANNNIKVGTYHVFRALTSTPAAQLQNIIQQTSKVNFDKDKDNLAISVMYQVNKGASPDQMADNLHSLLELLKKAEFKKIYINCNNYEWANHVAAEKYDFSQEGLWVSYYGQEPRIPDTWKDKGWTWWQYSCDEHIDGIPGKVCMNHVNQEAVSTLGLYEEVLNQGSDNVWT